MTKEELLQKLNEIEWDDFECKAAQDKLPEDVWATVSAFSNTSGGWVVFGIKQQGKRFEIQGVNNGEKKESDFLNTLRSGQKFNMRLSATGKKYNFDGKLVLAFFVWIVGRIVRTRSEFAVTDTRFVQKDGIFNIKMTEIPLARIETVNFYQSLWQRIIGTGCVEMVGSGGTSHQVHCIEHPMKVRKIIVASIKKTPQPPLGREVKNEDVNN